MQNHVNNFDEKKTKPKRKADRAIAIRLTQKDYDEIQKLIKKSGTTQTDFIRQACLKGKITDPQIMHNLINQIKIIGRNIHQILKVANTTKTINQTELDKLNVHVMEFKKLWQSLKR